MLRAFKYRLYPTKDQEILLNKTFGCVRWIYNWALEKKMSFYTEHDKGLSIFKIDKELTVLKNNTDTIWLREVNSQSLQSSLKHLDIAFTNFFRHKKGFPVFKLKNNKNSFSNPQRTTVSFQKSIVCFPKFTKGIKCVFHRKFEGKIKTSTVSKTKTGKYFISILVDDGRSEPKSKKITKKTTVGIDLGIRTYATLSDGTKIENPKYLQKSFKNIKKQRKRFSKKKQGSKNREKARIKLAKQYEKVTNSRKDFLHKLTHNLVENQDYNSFAIEDLNVKSMLKNKQLAQAIQDCAWATFRFFLEYKAKERGKNVLVIGRFEPSSKLCSCGFYNHKLTSRDKVWTCPECSITHDRDILAANNIKNFAFCSQNTRKVPQGLREFKPAESGGCREKSRCHSMKQEATKNSNSLGLNEKNEIE